MARFPNVEAIVIAFLDGTEGLKAYAEVPSERPSRFITVERIGGAQIDEVRENVRLAVQVWATSRLEASDLARAVNERLQQIASEPHVYRVSFSSLYNFPDLDSKTNRYQIVFELICSNNP